MNDLKEWLAGVGDRIVWLAKLSSAKKLGQSEHVYIDKHTYKVTVEEI
ncbi:unnamed protein product [Fructobacillus tropaeoli]|nr:unnamed protein product [Fructobacillus tropaeoli]